MSANSSSSRDAACMRFGALLDHNCTCSIQNSGLRHGYTCSKCRSQGLFTPPRVHPVIHYGTVICYDLVKGPVMPDDLLEHVVLHKRDDKVQCAYREFPASPVWIPWLLLNYNRTSAMRTDMAIEAAKVCDAFLPVTGLLWITVAEYAHGLMSDVNEPWGSHTQAFSTHLLAEKLTEFEKAVNKHRADETMRTHCALTFITSLEPINPMTELSNALGLVFTQCTANALLGHLPNAQHVGQNTSKFFDRVKPQPTLMGNRDVKDVKFVDAPGIREEFGLLMEPFCHAVKYGDTVMAPLCIKVKLSDNMDDDDVEDTPEPTCPPTPEVVYAYTPPSTPTTDRERELDAQDDAYTRYILPNIQQLERTHAERMRSIASIHD